MTVIYSNDKSGSYTDPNTWQNATVPSYNDTAVISAPDPIIVTVTDSSEPFTSAVMIAGEATLDVKGALYLRISDPSDYDILQGNLTVSDGGGLIVSGDLDSFVFNDETSGSVVFSGGSFDNVTVADQLVLSTESAFLYMGDATFSQGATLDVTGGASILDLYDTQVWNGASITLGDSSVDGEGASITIAHLATLTLAGGTTTFQGSATIDGGGILINQESMTVDDSPTKPASISIATASFENDGSVALTNAAGYGTFETVSGAVTGAGSFSLDESSKLEFKSTVGSGQTVTFLHDASVGVGGMVPASNILILDAVHAGATTAFAGAIAGANDTDRFDLSSVAFGSMLSGTVSGGVLTVASGGVTEAVLHTGASYTDGAAVSFAADGAGGVDVSVACFLAGTAITTADGQRPVEQIAPGDQVRTASGALRPVRWVGRRAYAGRFLLANPRLHPVRFAAGSLGSGLPARDLLVSPDHAMLLGGVLIPAAQLIDGGSIAVEHGLAEIAYHHLALDSHDAILAEGAACESYVDDGCAARFHDGAGRLPDGETGYCAPRAEHGLAVEAARRATAAARAA